MSDDVVTSTFHLGNAIQTTRTDNYENRTDAAILSNIANAAAVATLTGAKLYAGFTASAVAFLSGNSESPAIFAVAFSGNNVAITISDNTNVTVEVIQLVVRVTFEFGYIDYPVQVTVTAP